jgi:hypothetical protein
VWTSAQSWSEANLSALGDEKTEVAFNADKGDKQGPVTVGGGSVSTCHRDPASGNSSPGSPDSERKPETRLVALGDSDFATNQNIGFAGNRDFFMNTLNWRLTGEPMIAIRPRQPEIGGCR